LDDPRAEAGREVFGKQGCAGFHAPPLYTNNSLTPAAGFAVPEGHERKYNVHPVGVGTDPGLALKTRRGTGYYKVPSLKGVWYRGPLGHSGSVSTLEDWFDPMRLRDDYTPTGFKGYGIAHRSVPGHEFGLDLPAEDKAALIAFLRSL
jgi:cytochrome c peroxidase